MPQRSDYIHYSQLSTLLTCGYKHELAYVERLEPRTRVSRMDFGTFGHAALADRWLPGSTFFKDAVDEATRDCLPEELAEIKQTADTAFQVVERVFPELSAQYELFEDNVEKTLTINIEGTDRPFGGTPDIIVRDRDTGKLWILDYKFRSTFKEQESEWLNLQMITYSWLAIEHGMDIVGTRQIQIKPKLPKKPELTQKGKMSTADIYTDWETYSAACVEAGLNPEEYRATMAPKLAKKVFWDFDMCHAIRTQEELARHVQTTILPAIATLSNPRNTRCYNNLVCDWCGYRELCVGEMKGEDTDFMKQTLYRIKGSEDRIPVLEEDVDHG